MKFLFPTIIIMSIALRATAQKSGIIIDNTTGIPIREVKIYTNRRGVAETNWKGEFHIDGEYTSVTIVHPNYLSRTMNLYDMTDTIRLIPKYHTMDEVVIYGNAPKPFNPKPMLEEFKNYPKPSGHDFLSIFYKHRGLTKKQKKKHDEIINNY